MKKTLIIAAMAALSTAGLVAQTTNTIPTPNSITLAFPSNVPPALIQSEILYSAKDIAMQQILRASLVQLEAVNTNLAAFDGGDWATAQQIMTASVRSAKSLATVNALILALPSLTPRPAVVATNTLPAVVTSTNAP